ncbi:lysophospholipid acyltransferase family protein [Algicella marina]|uniref:Acyltransferase n=1 Tax=Algicella marina TaxID=2683284 RepID=A0A6P1SY78_9RHOB|nr:acyltransferase [Algicella marina]QHQ34166.1 acyltransferase [Algicella marina]
MGNRTAFGDYLENLPVRALIAATRPLPPERRGAVAAWCARRVLRNVSHLRGRVVDNLAHVFPEMDAKKREAILEGMATNLGRTFIEILHPGDLLARAGDFTWEGEEGYNAIMEAHASGKGAITLSAHYGQWEATRAFMQHQGVEVGAIYRPLKNRFSDADLTQRYERFGAPLFPKGRSGTRALIKHVSSGKTLGILHDQKIDDGLLLDFLGQPAATAPMAAELALKFKRPLVASYATRGPDLQSIHIEFDPPIPHTDAAEMTQAMNDGLARRVRTHPEQYYWLHRRWQIRNPRHLEELEARARQAATSP